MPPFSHSGFYRAPVNDLHLCTETVEGRACSQSLPRAEMPEYGKVTFPDPLIIAGRSEGHPNYYLAAPTATLGFPVSISAPGDFTEFKGALSPEPFLGDSSCFVQKQIYMRESKLDLSKDVNQVLGVWQMKGRFTGKIIVADFFSESCPYILERIKKCYTQGETKCFRRDNGNSAPDLEFYKAARNFFDPYVNNNALNHVELPDLIASFYEIEFL